MAYARYTPPAPLSTFVKLFWYWEGAPGVPAKERLMPTGEPYIIVNLRDEPLRVYSPDDPTRFETRGLAMIAGARTTPTVIDNQQQDRVFGIQFRAGGAFPFLRMPAGELENHAVPLSDVWFQAAGELRERLLEAPAITDMFRSAEIVLLHQLTRPPAFHEAVSYSLQRFQAAPWNGVVAGVTQQIGLSQRRYIQLFRAQVGLNPKAFCRVQRFQGVLVAIHPARDVDWVQVALENGYYDQAHFIHDFREFSGLTPTQYWHKRTAHLNHVPIPE